MVDQFKLEKLNKLTQKGVNAYPYSYNQTHHASEIIKQFDRLNEKEVSVAGRIVGFRKMGGLYFMDLLDSTGKIQILIKKDGMDQINLDIVEHVDVGDILGITGKVIKTSTGQISVDSENITMLAKSLLTLPEKFHGLTDTEQRYRKRYLDFMMNPKVRDFFVTRAKMIRLIREFLNSKGYVEFETPVLQPTYGGASARPFTTRFEALKSDMYLRISLELYLKRLVVGGFEKVYEISKNFRNEDIDSTHNPEFTMLECYESYKDYEDYMKMTEEMLSNIVKDILGSHKMTYQGKELDFKPPFKRIYWVEELKKKTGVDVSEIDDKKARELAKSEKLDVSIKNRMHVADALFDKYIKPEISDPTFVVDFPAYMCPLAKDKRGNKLLSERFELFIAGKEAANCFSELTDPIEQRKKFQEQDEDRRKGDDEAPPADEDFLEAVEYGMPPTAGLGIGLDRLAMILTDNVSIKEVLAFPTVKPEKDFKLKNR